MSLHCDPSELLARAKQARTEGRLDEARAALIDAMAVVRQTGDTAQLDVLQALLEEVERSRRER